MPPTKTRKSDKRAHRRPDSTPVAAETPLGFFEKFYAPHGNPKWKQLDARGLAQIIIDAERRRDEFQNQISAKSLPPKEKGQASRRVAVNMPNDRLKKKLSPQGLRALGGLDVLSKNPYADDVVSGRNPSRRTTVSGPASKSAPGLKPSAHGSSASADGAAVGGKGKNAAVVPQQPVNLEPPKALNEHPYRDIWVKGYKDGLESGRDSFLSQLLAPFPPGTHQAITLAKLINEKIIQEAAVTGASADVAAEALSRALKAAAEEISKTKEEFKKEGQEKIEEIKREYRKIEEGLKKGISPPSPFPIDF